MEIKNGVSRTQFTALRDDINRINELLKEGKCPTCHHNIDVNEQNSFIEEKKREQNKIAEDGKKTNKEIEQKTKDIETCKGEIKAFEEAKEKVNQREKLKIELEAYKANIEKLKTSKNFRSINYKFENIHKIKIQSND